VIEISDLPALNAALNGISAVLLTAGYVFIRRGRRAAHKKCMLAALYFSILITHVVLAATILPLALTTTAHGLRAQYTRHVKVAQWTLPTWLYVSVTGVVIYVLLYQIY